MTLVARPSRPCGVERLRPRVGLVQRSARTELPSITTAGPTPILPEAGLSGGSGLFDGPRTRLPRPAAAAPPRPPCRSASVLPPPPRRKRVHALCGVDLSLRRGHTHGLVSESGSGKSTLARCVLGLQRPDDGSVVFDGTEIVGLRPGRASAASFSSFACRRLRSGRCDAAR
ncbi:ATP-binding cassette domain-containing protein [Microbispora rosea]|uniref:ATP-binding cassette domain-containing protein n=1 Tax=Microbispora rosea TaxID=58117 RepID=UPI0034425D7C